MLDLTAELGGIVEMPTEDYHAHEALSASTVKRLIVNDETYEVANGIPTEETAAMTLGTLIHCMILEPHKFTEEYAVMPKVDLRTKEGKAVKEMFMFEHGGKKIITADDHETALKCAEAFSNSGVSKLLCGKSEQKFFSYFGDVPVRGMLDHYDEDSGTIIDLKTTQNYADGFVKECGDRFYCIQAAFYTDLLQSLGKPVNDFLFVGVQSKAPYKITVVRMNAIDIETGRDFYNIGIDIWKDLKANPDRYKNQLCVNPADGGVVFDYVTPTWAFYKMDKLRKQKGA